jgi:dienelactone hydrolase
MWYPAAGIVGGGGTQPVAAGVFPLVLFSHGLKSSPEAHQSITRRFAAAGFIVAAPAYPYTSSEASSYNPVDVVNQPADGSAVITSVLTLNTTPGDPLAGHVDPARVGAAGHSGGAVTTLGMLAGARDYRLRSAIVLAGGPGGSFCNPAASLLFVHGDQDHFVTYPNAQAVYAQVPWPKAFLTVVNGDHDSYLYAATPAASAVVSTMLDFLRWTLYADPAALARIPGDASVAGATTFESTL